MCVKSYHNLCWSLANAHAVQMIPQQSAYTVSTVQVSSAVAAMGYLRQAGCRWAEYRYSAGQRNFCRCGRSGGTVSWLRKAPVTSGNKGCTENLKLAHAISPLPLRKDLWWEKWRWDRFWFYLRFILSVVISATRMFSNLWQGRTVDPFITCCSSVQAV